MSTGDERRRALRGWAREHHPDVGGDLASYLAGVERIESRYAAPAPPSSAPLRVVLAPWPVRLSRRLRRRLRRTRRRRSALL